MVPEVLENEPATQGKGRHMPANGHSVPTGHAAHAVEAVFDVNVPAVHAVHSVDAGAEVKEPESQGVSALEVDWLVSWA